MNRFLTLALCIVTLQLNLSCSNGSSSNPPPQSATASAPAPTPASAPASDTFSFSSKIKISDGLKSKLSAKESQVLDAINSGEKISFQTVSDLVLEKEQRDFETRSQTKPAQTLAEMLSKIAPVKNEPTLSPYAIKNEYEFNLRKIYADDHATVYDSTKSSLVDPFVSNSLQCYSGTLLYLSVRRLMGKVSFEETHPVVILESGHIIPGHMIKTDKGYRLAGVETTFAGDGYRDFGIISEPTVGIIDASLFAVIHIFSDLLENNQEVREQALTATAKMYDFKLTNVLSNYGKAEEKSSVGRPSPLAFGVPPQSKPAPRAEGNLAPKITRLEDLASAPATAGSQWANGVASPTIMGQTFSPSRGMELSLSDVPILSKPISIPYFRENAREEGGIISGCLFIETSLLEKSTDPFFWIVSLPTGPLPILTSYFHTIDHGFSLRSSMPFDLESLLPLSFSHDKKKIQICGLIRESYDGLVFMFVTDVRRKILEPFAQIPVLSGTSGPISLNTDAIEEWNKLNAGLAELRVSKPKVTKGTTGDTTDPLEKGPNQ